MPVLPNIRHEAFAQHRLKGKSADEAYALAGYKAHHSNAHRMSTNEHILSRIAELQAKVAKKVEVTIESLATELDEARDIAKGEKQSSAMVQATMGKAKLFGLGSETKKLQGTIQVITITAAHLDALNENELAALETAYPVLQKLGLVGGHPGAAAEAAG